MRRAVATLISQVALWAPGAPALAQVPEVQDAAPQLAESHTVARLAPTHPRRLFVLDTMFPAAEAARTYILDGSTGALEGMFNQAYWPNFAVAPDGKELYAVDSYWEKHTRGKRSDFLVVRDAQTLEIKDEIALPPDRLLAVSKKYNFDVTPDGRFGLTYSLAPTTAVNVTDLAARKFVGSIAIPGCGLVFAQAPNRFSTLCADGSVETATFNDEAKASVMRATHVFDAVNDPAFEHSAWDKKDQMLYLVTYHGDVIPVRLAGDRAETQARWSLTTPAERTQGWLPGGWQVSHFHSAKQRLYVLMHRGKYWTHKSPGQEVWIFDARDGRRLRRIVLKEPANSVAVSPDQDALVYVITESGRVCAYKEASGKMQYRGEPLGTSPQLLTVWGD